jgi:transcription-repair coupling factor (superfamily II helicase)
LLNLPQIEFTQQSSFSKVRSDYRDKKFISVFGVQRFAKVLLALSCKRAAIICSDVSEARAFFDALSSCGARATFLPPKEDVMLYASVKSGENIIGRLRAFYEFKMGVADYLVASASALTDLYPDEKDYTARIKIIDENSDYDLPSLIRTLVSAGYRRVDQVSDYGQFSLRGDILDVYAPTYDAPLRIEFFGDTVDKITLFDADTQLSQGKIQRAAIPPFAEIFGFDDDLARRLKADFYAKLNPDEATRRDEIISSALSSVESGEIKYAQNWLLPYCKNCGFFGFFAPERIIIDGAKACYDALQNAEKDRLNRFDELYRKGEAPRSLKGAAKELDGLVFPSDVGAAAFHNITSQNRFFNPEAVYKVDCAPLASYARDYKVLEADLSKWRAGGYRVYFCLTDHSKTIITDFLKDKLFGTGDKITIDDSGLDHGCVFKEDKIVVVGNADVSFKRNKLVASRRKNVFSLPEKGDYVVHEVHGIGLCEGVKKMEVMGALRDYLVISYAGGDKLYEPIENLDRLSKYVSGGNAPKLSKMGGADFGKIKEKVKQSVKKLAVDLMDLYGERMAAKGHAYSPDDSLLHEFEARFPYAETDDQLRAVEECLQDLKAGKIMDRLLCGDVGYGKTEVALRIAFKVICEGKQVAFMAPTTILAKQHFETVKKRMEEFGVKAVRLTRFDSPSSVKESEKLLETGGADIVVGTHKMLAKTVKFKDLGLLILDEEQRFGVSDKEKIKDLKRNVDVLTLSATPIPRTLHMSMVGIRDISILDAPPLNRIPVETFVSEYSPALLKDAVLREVGRGGQAFVVYNRVARIDAFAASLAELIPDVRIIVAHGQLDEKTLERRVDDFIGGKADVLVSSTIIENGIDMPRANTLFVVDADEMGLSQLYQLKGRVGRSERMAYAYFTYDERKSITEAAYKRLEALASYTDFGSGFKIAMKDMEIRGAGNIMGAEQHGHMEKVGYDTYCKLLKEAIAEAEGKTVAQKTEVRVAVDYDAYIPEKFVPDGEWRLRLYSRISQVSTVVEREKLLEEIKDVYGDIPDAVKNLVSVALVKNLAANIGATVVELKRKEHNVYFAKVLDVSRAVNDEATRYQGRLIIEDRPYIKFLSNDLLVKFLLNCNKNLA